LYPEGGAVFGGEAGRDFGARDATLFGERG
jgi:hypothetical protein